MLDLDATLASASPEVRLRFQMLLRTPLTVVVTGIVDRRRLLDVTPAAELTSVLRREEPCPRLP
jgi:hypothetical protein